MFRGFTLPTDICPPSSPTHAASIQCAFGSPCLSRLYLVLPPVPVDTGSPVCASISCALYRAALMAAASLSGLLAWASSLLRRSGALAKNTRTSDVPFFSLHDLQERVRLLTRSVPPLALGTICSF